MNSTAALFPVILLIICGWGAGKLRWIQQEHLPGLANLVFLMLAPALLFRTMSHVGFDGLDFKATWVYLAVAFALFIGVSLFLGGHKRAIVIGLACIFSNSVMIGIPLVTMAYGPEGLVTLITLISVHALTLLSAATLFFEWRKARDEMQQAAESDQAMKAGYSRMLEMVGKAAWRSVMHPVTLPIIAGVVWGMTGWQLPGVVDRTLELLGQANGPVSLVLVGATLAHTRMKGELKGALEITLVKNLLMPVLVFAAGYLLGIRGVPLVVITVVAALPIGSNVYLFSHRYGEAQSLVTASLALTTLAALVTQPVVMWLAARWA